jgi:hypothetical protein
MWASDTEVTTSETSIYKVKSHLVTPTNRPHNIGDILVFDLCMAFIRVSNSLSIFLFLFYFWTLENVSNGSHE